LPNTPVEQDSAKRLSQYKYREDLALKAGGASVLFIGALVIAVVTTDFSKHAPAWIRILTLIVFILIALCIAVSWAGFHWAAEKVERVQAAGSSGNVGPWPTRPEIAWTIVLYLFIVDGALLVGTVILALI
jgi:TRAP-type mannitol/chloroaromatic compound transport system permease small subunit